MTRWYASLILIFSLSSCQSTDRDPYTYTEHGQKYCSKHRVPFVTRRMFEADGNRVILVHYGEERCAECSERFPNEIGPRYARRRTSFYNEPTTAAYCPICEAAFQKCVAVVPVNQT
jgi:hypothetical protein